MSSESVKNLPSKKVLNTINLATHLHRDQYRHDENKTPYVSHLFGVAMFVRTVTDDEDIVCAALMHDSLEDVADYTYDNLVSDCGVRVADIVRGVTEDKSLPYKERKTLYLENIKNGSVESLIVSLADKIHNAQSFAAMSEDKKHKGHEFVYTGVLEISTEKLGADHILVKKLKEEIEKL